MVTLRPRGREARFSLASGLGPQEGAGGRELASLRRALWSRVQDIFLLSPPRICETRAPKVSLALIPVPHAQAGLLRARNLSGEWVPPHRPAVFPVGVETEP